MVPPKEPEPALAAPGTEELLATPGSALTGPRKLRRHRDRPLRHVHLELDLAPKHRDPSGTPLLEQLAKLLKERTTVERGTLVMLAGATLHAVASQGFRRVDHWEVSPGGWLPPPRPGPDSRGAEPVGDLLAALKSEAGSPIASARSFSARLSDLSGDRVDVTIRRVHRERRHSLSVDLWGTFKRATVRELDASFWERLPVVRSALTRFEYV